MFPALISEPAFPSLNEQQREMMAIVRPVVRFRQIGKSARVLCGTLREPGVHPRNCQEPRGQTKVTRPDNKPLTHPTNPKKVGRFYSWIWYSELRIEKRKKPNPPRPKFARNRSTCRRRFPEGTAVRHFCPAHDRPTGRRARLDTQGEKPCTHPANPPITVEGAFHPRPSHPHPRSSTLIPRACALHPVVKLDIPRPPTQNQQLATHTTQGGGGLGLAATCKLRRPLSQRAAHLQPAT